MADNKEAFNNGDNLNKQVLMNGRTSMLSADPDIECIAAMPIEAVKEELQQMGLNFNEVLPDRISQRICRTVAAQNVTFEPVALTEKTSPLKSRVRSLPQRLRLKGPPQPLMLQAALFVLGLLCATAILFLVTDIHQWFPRAGDIETDGQQAAPLTKLGRIYVKTSDNDLLSVKARDNMIVALKANGALSIVEKPEEADSTLDLLVKQNAEDKKHETRPAARDSSNGKASGEQTVSITVQLIKREGEQTEKSFEGHYTGQINEITTEIVEDLLLLIQKKD